MTTKAQTLRGGEVLLRWVDVAMEGLPWSNDASTSDPMTAFGYIDQQAGLSLRGGRAGEANVATQPSVTLRFPSHGGLADARVLDAAEVAQRGLPERPSWLSFYGRQPVAGAPWRSDLELCGQFLDTWPDDLQVLIHDSEPRWSGHPGEHCWVRVEDAVECPERPTATEDNRPGPSLRQLLYVGTLLNQPFQIKSASQGQRVYFYADSGGALPTAVSASYVSERPQWLFNPCASCGVAEFMEPPSQMIAKLFPSTDIEMVAFTFHCSRCGGGRVVTKR